MTSLATPSAKSHERVTGRWNRDLHAESKLDWTVYYIKLIVGSPVPYLFIGFACALFVSRAAVEIFAWAASLLTVAYIIVDRFAREKEFEFWRAGSDLLLLGFFVVSVIGIAQSSSTEDFFLGLGTLRWIPLIYFFLYIWQLFPGLNRIFNILIGCAVITSIYCIYQHFAGIDLIRGMSALPYAPIKGYAYSMVVGFFRHPEILGTILAILLPFPIATFMLADKTEKPSTPILALGAMLLMSAAIFWTYKVGIWQAAIAGIGVTAILQPKRHLTMLLVTAAFLAAMMFGAYGSPDNLISQVKQEEVSRGERQRAQINKQIEIWNQNTLIGTGMRAQEVRDIESLDGNVYFQLLAQTGTLGLAFYLLFSLNFLLGIYRIWREIPRTHFWHKVLCTGGIGAMASFHVAGLYWPTLTDSHALLLFVLLLSALSYLAQQYDRGLVPDDQSL